MSPVRLIEALPPTGRGIAYMLASTVAFGLLWALIRLASETYEPALIVFYRTLFGLLFLLPLILRRGRVLFSTRRLPLHLLRSGTGVIAMYATFYAIALAPLADVVAISYATPLFATVTAALFLGETIRARRIAAVAIGLVGVMVVLRPGLETLGPGQGWALLAAVMVAGSLTAIKLLSRTDSPETIVAFTFTLILPVNFVIALFVWRWPDWGDLVLLAAIGGLANLGQITLTRAFTAADVTAVLPFDFVRLVLAAGFGVAMFGEPLEWETVAGALIILLSSVYLAHREARIDRRRLPPPTAP